MEPSVNKILNKLNNEKIKLATQKVDLAGIEDLDKAQFDVDFFIKNVLKEMTAADKLLTKHDQLRKQISISEKDMLSLEKVGQRSIDDALKTYGKVEKQLKQLGISNSNVPMMGQLIKSVDKAKDRFRTLSDILNYMQTTT